MSAENHAGHPDAPDGGATPSSAGGNTPAQPGGVAGRIPLSDGYSVTSEFFEEIRLRIGGRLPELQPHCVYTAEQLAGKDFWRLLDSGDQRTAGRCVARMVCHGMLPLTFVEGKHEYPKRYQLK